MADFATGGANALEIFSVTDTGSAYTINTGAGQKIFLQGLENLNADPATGLLSTTQIIDNEDFYNFIKANQQTGEITEPQTIRLTDGTEVKSIIAGGDTKLVAAVNYGVAKDGKRKCAIMLGRLQNSGAWLEQFNEFSRPTLEIQGIQPAYNVVFDTVLRDTAPTALVATTATATLTTTVTSGLEVVYLALPA